MGESLKKSLLNYKQKLLNDMVYVDSRLKEARNINGRELDNDCESSDSDVDMTANIDLGPKVSELKQLQSRLKTCLQATEELTGVHVLESQVEVVVQEPVFESCPPINEDGTWYEVVAECKLDLVHFLITFFLHKSDRKFGPTHYRGLKVNAVKKAHELELAPALVDMDSPGNAVKLFGEFASYHRARRTSLARLADKFAGALHMTPRLEGGFNIKCLDVLEMRWTIKYSRSKCAFNHSLKFDIDHMDDKHLQIVKQYYQQLDPSIGTDKRTLLLEKIIHTCIESKGTTLEMYESTESDQETIERHQYHRKILDNHEEAVKIREKPTINKDSEIMAPPKALPKKTKPKGKENKVANETDNSVKRSIENSEEATVKKPKKDAKAVAANDKDKSVKRTLEESEEVANKKHENDAKVVLANYKDKNVKRTIENTEEVASKKQKKDAKVASKQIISENNIANNDNAQNNDKDPKDKEKCVHKEKTIKKTIDKPKIISKDPNLVKNTNSEKTTQNITKKDKELKKTATEPKIHKNDAQKTTEKAVKVNRKPVKNDQQKLVENPKVTSKKSNDVAKINTAGTVKDKSVKNKEKNINEQVSTIDKRFEKRTANPNVANTKDAKSMNKKTDSSGKSVGKIKRKSIKDVRKTFNVNDKSSPRNKIPTVPPKSKLPAKQPDIGGDLTGVSVTSQSKIPLKSNFGPLRISPRKSVQMKPKTFKPNPSGQEHKKVTHIPRLLNKPETKNNK